MTPSRHQRKEIAMSERWGRRDRPQKMDRGQMLLTAFMVKWQEEEEDSVQAKFCDLFDYFREHQSEMKMITDGENYWFRFVGDGGCCIAIETDDDGEDFIGTVHGPDMDRYDNEASTVIDI